MTEFTFKEIGERLSSAFRLAARPLAVYGSETLPIGTNHLSDVNRCFAVSLYQMATKKDVSAIYVSADSPEGCCLGGLYHVGFIPVPEDIKYFISTGRKDVQGGAAEFLKSSPEMVDRCNKVSGKISPLGKYLIIQACEAVPDHDPGVRSICCFGYGEQIRNMAALVHFDRDDPFSPVIVPWGSACSTFITFPAGMAENTPKNTAFMGPQDPTQNYILPAEMMALGIPVEIVKKMVKNLDASFVVRRPQVAFPNRRKKSK